MSPAYRHRTLAVALVATLALGVTACGRTGGSGEAADGEDRRSGDPSAAQTKADFASITNVCQPGAGGGATAQGVTAEEIKVGVMTDFGFTQNREFINAAEAFTKWCNDAGGINGRKLGFNTRDAKLFEYRQRVVEACRQDFFLVGGGAAFDGSGTKDRLRCLLPEIPGQTVSLENRGSDLQVDPLAFPEASGLYPGYFRWLVKEAHPESTNAVGLIVGRRRRHQDPRQSGEGDVRGAGREGRLQRRLPARRRPRLDALRPGDQERRGQGPRLLRRLQGSGQARAVPHRRRRDHVVDRRQQQRVPQGVPRPRRRQRSTSSPTTPTPASTRWRRPPTTPPPSSWSRSSRSTCRRRTSPSRW